MPTQAQEQPTVSSVRVLIVDDHRMFGESLHRVLDDETGVDVVGTASTIAEGLEAVRTSSPDVVLMDYELPDGNGAQATELVKAARPETKVVILSERVDEVAVSAAIEAGCADYVPKQEPVEALVSSVRAVASGNRRFSRALLARFLPRWRRGRDERRAAEAQAATGAPGRKRGSNGYGPFGRPAGAGRPTTRAERRGHDLTNREMEVLHLLAQGLSSRDIAERLVISVNTARHHIQKTIAKMGAHSKLEAVSIAVRDGIIRYP